MNCENQSIFEVLPLAIIVGVISIIGIGIFSFTKIKNYFTNPVIKIYEVVISLASDDETVQSDTSSSGISEISSIEVEKINKHIPTLNIS